MIDQGVYQEEVRQYVVQQPQQQVFEVIQAQPVYQPATIITNAEHRPVVMKQSLPMVRSVVAPVQTTVVTSGPRVVQQVVQVQPQPVIVVQERQNEYVQETIDY